MFNWNTDYKRVRWFILATMLFLLTGCGTESVFEGSRVSDASGFTMEYSILNQEESADLILTEGDRLKVSLSHTEGSVDVTVRLEGKEPIYRGNGQRNADFVLEIAETGSYHISVSGHQAKGNVSFTRAGMKQEKSMVEQLIVYGKTYRILRLLGHGKGGYSWLADSDGQTVVVKQIHHEPCDYYTFGNKIEAERRDYARLKEAGIRIPQMLAIDIDVERIVKEYIEGPTVFELVKSGTSSKPYLAQVRDMAAKAKAAGLNIDWFPANFVVRDGVIWYVDYECNAFLDEWSFENWGIRYWSRTPEFEAYLNAHQPVSGEADVNGTVQPRS